jgi:hypothetical protein
MERPHAENNLLEAQQRNMNETPAIDFQEHNAEVKRVWEAYHAGKPYRVPVTLGINPRFTLLNPQYNPEGITFEEYSSDPQTMLDVQVRFFHFVRHNIVFDAEMGLPKDGWDVYVDLQNYYEAAWFGAEVRFYEGEVPDTVPFLTDDRKNLLFSRGLPDPLGGIMRKNLDYAEFFARKRAAGYEHAGRPINRINIAAMGTDGPFTAAANLRGATSICIDIYEDPDYVHRLLDYITQATILRIKTLRALRNEPFKTRSVGFADDSIALLSKEAYREFVLPYHRKFVETFGEGGPHSIHLCGDSTRHFPMLRDELNIQSFDTGFPVDFGWLRKALGPDVTIYGGPRVPLLRDGTPEQVRDEVERVCQSGIMQGGKFVLREGNNLAPGTPLENLRAMYQAALEFGRYDT